MAIEGTSIDLEILAEVRRAMAERGQPDLPSGDNFSALVMQLVANPDFTKQVQDLVDTKDLKGLFALFEEKNISVSSEAMATFLSTKDIWYKLRQVAKSFGHANLGTFN